jgi:hypothetical protein
MMQYPILESMLGSEVLQLMIESWPDKCLDAHGPLNRLPTPLCDKILTSITSLTEAYQGSLFELDPQKGNYQLYPAVDGTAGDVIKDGRTAYLADIAPLLNNADGFVNALEQELNIKQDSTRLSAFVSAAGSGSPVHYDALDVISIQLVGTKRFFLAPLKHIRYPYGSQYTEGTAPFKTLYPQISDGFPSCKNQIFEEIDMLPGSVLLMPRGTWHYTEAKQDSMAMSIILSPATQIDFFLSLLKSTLLQSSEWRSPIYGLGNTDAFDPKLYTKLSNTIYRLAKEYQNPNSALRCFHKNSRYLTNPALDVQIIKGEAFDDVEYDGHNKHGEAGRIQMKVPSGIANVARWLLNIDGPFIVKDCLHNFPMIPAQEIQELFGRLEKTGFLTKLWFPEI